MTRIASAEIWEAGKYRFVRPFQVRLEIIEGGALARLDELDLWMDGFDDLDALADLCDSLTELVSDLLSSTDAQLGPSPRRWKRTIETALAGA